MQTVEKSNVLVRTTDCEMVNRQHPRMPLDFASAH
jgi:hypothetical protein